MALTMAFWYLCVFLVSISRAQQFPLFKYSYHTLPGLSDECVKALNASVDCSDFLYSNAASL